MLLNDVQNEQQRLAYLLGGSVERYAGGGHRIGAMVALVVCVILLLVLFWLIFRITWG